MRIYAAGIESTTRAKAVAALAPEHGDFLGSFFIIRGARRERRRENAEIVRRAASGWLLIDSGAHTLLAQDPTIGSNKARRPGRAGRVEPDAFFDEYVDWLSTHRDLYDWFVELDIAELAGRAAVDRWRRCVRDAGLADRCLLVWHPLSETFEDFLRVADDWPSGYVALEGIRDARRSIDYGRALRELYRLGIRVHGFALVNRRVLATWPFYSVDSLGWLSGEAYGAIPVAGPRGATRWVRAERPRNLRHAEALESAVREVGFDVLAGHGRRDKAVLHSARQATMRLALDALARQAEFFTDYWKARGVDWDAAIAKRVAS